MMFDLEGSLREKGLRLMDSTKNARRALLAAALLGTVAASAWGCGESTTTSSSSGRAGCPAGLTDCGGACVDTHHDPGNCGACGTTCSSAETCLAGACTVSCQGGTVLCGSACVSTSFDPAHCGDCDTACPEGQVCSLGTCGVSCLGGTTLCGGLCADTQVDGAHCGDCATACAPGEKCEGGACKAACGPGTTLCDGACVDTALDPSHCGDCATACDAGQVCSAGACGTECTGGTTLCGAACADTQSDEAHCGDCVTSCGLGETCTGGHCCPGGLTYCSGVCADTTQSPVDCGACGVVCAGGDICLGGACAPSPLFAADGRAHTVGNLYTVDPLTGQTQVVVALHSPYAGLAFHNRLLYGVTTGGTVHQINPTTGVETAVASVGYYGPRDLALRSDGLLLACNNNNDFVTIDVLAKAATSIGGYCANGVGFASDAAGITYLLNYNTLSTLDLGAQLTQVATLSPGAVYKAASFHHGVLYAFASDEGPPYTLASIDVVTGAVTTVGPVAQALHAIASASP